MTNHTFNINQAYVTNKTLVSHRNQDETLILMKLDDANIFYKIDGLSAKVWDALKAPNTAQSLLKTLTTKFNDVAPETIQSDLTKLMQQFLSLNIIEVSASGTNELTTDIAPGTMTNYNFGQIKEFDLAQIESEVLNESIYLDVFAGSDLRLKKNVTGLKNTLEKIVALEGISYQWNEQTAAPTAPKTNQVGLIAQQMAEVFPELVKKDADTGMLAVNYTKLTPYLVESIKELKALVDAQNARIEQLEKDLKNLKH